MRGEERAGDEGVGMCVDDGDGECDARGGEGLCVEGACSRGRERRRRVR